MEAAVVIALILIAGFGGIFYILPSRKQRRLTHCRVEARSFGFVVNSVSLPKVDTSPEEKVSAGGLRRNPTLLCCAYALPSYDNAIYVPTWQLRRASRSVLPLPGWEFADGLPVHVQLSNETYWREIGDILDESPPRCLALTSDQSGVAWIGQENITGTTEEFLRALKQVLKKIQRLNETVVKDSPA